MLKISDILKKKRPPVSSSAGPAAVPLEKLAPADPERPAAACPVCESDHTDAVPQHDQASRSAAAGFYQQAVIATRPLMTAYASDAHLGKARECIDAFIRQMHADPESLAEFFFHEYPADTDYLAHHAVNVCILSLTLGRILNLDPAKLPKLGLAALLHDMGIVKVREIIARPQQLNEQELAEMRKHPAWGKDLAAKMSGEIDFEVFDVIQQEHERVDGSGYPQGLKDNEISEGAKIVAVADVYEALTHDRPQRPRYAGREAIRQMLERKQSFSQPVLKALINSMGIFPLGTRVALNTRETGVVVRQTQNMPLRPTIMITHNAQRHQLPDPKRIDLAKNFSMYIKEFV